MRVLYIAPRYHSNQIPVMAGWLKAGHEVCFISQVSNSSENYTVLKPIVLGYSKISECLADLFCKVSGHNLADDQFAVKTKCCMPPKARLKEIITDFRPDVVILRERCVYCAVAYAICKKQHIDCIFYNQSPLYGFPRKKGLRAALKRLSGRLDLFPPVRMTPIIGWQEGGELFEKNSYYVPFVMEPHFSPEEKAAVRAELDGNDPVGAVSTRIVCVGLFNKIKRLDELIDSLESLKDKYAFTLTIAGEVINDEQKTYFNSLQERIASAGLKERVTLKPNCNRDQVFELLKQADLFILPSIKDCASVAQLEAMSCSLPVIRGFSKGYSFNLKEHYNGFVFYDQETMTQVLDQALSDRDKLIEMGTNSYKTVCDELSFDSYFKGIREMLSASHKLG